MGIRDADILIVMRGYDYCLHVCRDVDSGPYITWYAQSELTLSSTVMRRSRVCQMGVCGGCASPGLSRGLGVAYHWWSPERANQRELYMSTNRLLQGCVCEWSEREEKMIRPILTFVDFREVGNPNRVWFSATTTFKVGLLQSSESASSKSDLLRVVALTHQFRYDSRPDFVTRCLDRMKSEIRMTSMVAYQRNWKMHIGHGFS